MASEHDDPFDGVSQNASHLQEPDSYDNLLGIQVPITAPDLPTPEFRVEPDQPRLAIDRGSLPDTILKEPLTEAFAQNKDADADTLLDFAAEPRKIAVSEDTVTTKSNPIPAWHDAAKKDPPNESSPSNGFIGHRVVEDSNAENNISAKKEKDEHPYNKTSMSDDVISISDDDNIRAALHKSGDKEVENRDLCIEIERTRTTKRRRRLSDSEESTQQTQTLDDNATSPYGNTTSPKLRHRRRQAPPILDNLSHSNRACKISSLQHVNSKSRERKFEVIREINSIVHDKTITEHTRNILIHQVYRSPGFPDSK